MLHAHVPTLLWKICADENMNIAPLSAVVCSLLPLQKQTNLSVVLPQTDLQQIIVLIIGLYISLELSTSNPAES